MKHKGGKRERESEREGGGIGTIQTMGIFISNSIDSEWLPDSFSLYFV